MIQTLGPPPVNTKLKISGDRLDFGDNLPFSKWLNLVHQMLEGVGPRLASTQSLTFPACPPQSSVDVNMAVPGVEPDAGMTVVLGLPSSSIFTANNTFTAFISARDVVTIREVCCDAFGIGGFTDIFTVMILT